MPVKLDVIREYFLLLERLVSDAAALEDCLHPEFKQREFPNTLNPRGQESDRADALRRAALAKNILSEQSFRIMNAVESAEQIVVEALWTGRMAVDAGPLKAGQELQAHFCIVCEFKEGKIYRQRNYDCFEPFS